MRIAVVAPSCTLKREAADRVQAIVAGTRRLRARHPPAMLSHRRPFRGAGRRRGWRRCARSMADPAIDAVWFARGGYGSNRIAEAALADLPEAARGKLYMGYSDAGFLHAGLHKAGLERGVGADAAGCAARAAARRRSSARSTGWCAAIAAALEPGLDGPAMAFNLTVLSNLLGTPLEPDFTRGRPADRGCRRAALPDRPDDVPFDRQRQRSPGRGRSGLDGSATSCQRPRIRRGRARRSCRIGATGRVSRSAAPRTSVTIQRNRVVPFGRGKR